MSNPQHSSHLQWMIIQNNSCFLRKNSGRTFTAEPANLKGRNTYRLNGLIHNKTLDIQPTADNKGVVLTTKKTGKSCKPGSSNNSVTLNKGSRKINAAVRRTIRKNRYRRDLKMPALRRVSAILQSQKPKSAK